VTSDQAKLLRWQVEQITFPSAFWSNRDLADYLICELQRAENVHGRLSNIAVSMIAASVPSTSMKNTREAAHRAFIASCASPTFFVLVECALPRLFQEIAEGALERAHLHWSEALRLATRNTWNLLRQLVGQTPRALRAEARALMDVSVLLRTLEADLSIFSPEILP
jgi:CRISPR system Cascade subunit CasA